MKNVTFSETLKLDLVDSIIVVAYEDGRGFAEDKLREVFDKVLPKRMQEATKDLGYAKIESFDISLSGRVVEIVVAGAGRKDMASRASMEKLGGYIFNHIRSKDAHVCLMNSVEMVGIEAASAYLASGILLKSWIFDKYKTAKKPPKIKSMECQTSYTEINRNAFEDLSKVAEGVFAVRSMVTEPANVMTPEQIVEEAVKLKKLGVKVTVLDAKDLAKLEMNALLAVAQGSDRNSYVVAMEYKAEKDMPPVALVGKGITFDAGGLSLKPSKDMWRMKMDMTGAAVVIGTLKTLALKKSRTNVVGVIGIAENVISGRAQRPGDVVVSMSKKTIEVDNTDAEGRLILADVLWYTKERFSPQAIVDFATLTGAIQIALGHEYAGLFSNSDELSSQLMASSEYVGEKLWRLPLHPSYASDIKSDIADVKNTGCGRGAGSITAAMFLKEFVGEGTKWAHLDIAATEWDDKVRALSGKGATGFGVRLMDDFIEKHYSRSKGD
ncbi:MAG: leucyl aminopeptidase [Holosporales bacterium]|nr:leucyl aminopeptidase [Holosporales bacterium]